MKLRIFRQFLGAIAGVILMSCTTAPVAEDYPSRPIRLLVPFAPGGGTDVVTRIVGQRLSESWAKAVVIDNRPGAAGIAAFEIVARAPADGYTLATTSTSQAIFPSLYPKLPYDPVKDFAPVALMTRLQGIVVSGPSFPPNSVKELIAYARTRPGEVNFASTGTGGIGHLTLELIKKMAGISMTHVPYKGSAPAYNDLMSGQVQLLSNNIISTMPLIRSGKLKPLAVTGAARSAIAPSVPTVAESGLPGFEGSSWFGIVAPARTPKAVVDKLNREIVRIVQTADVRERLQAQGAEVAEDYSPDAFGRMLQMERDKWADVIKSVGIKLEGLPQ